MQIYNITISNVSGDAHKGSAGYIDCDPSAPCTEITLDAVHFSAAKHQPSPVVFNCNATDRKTPCTEGCGNANGMVSDVVPDPCLVVPGLEGRHQKES